jgi:hypothetical protein
VPGPITRSWIEGYSVDHLESAAAQWSASAELLEYHAEGIHAETLRPGGTVWEGTGADAAAERSWGNVVKARGAADCIYCAAGIAREGAGDLMWSKGQAQQSITDAEAAGFTVSEDLQPFDNAGPLMRQTAARQAEQQAFAADITAKAQALAAMDQQVASQITSAVAPLNGFSFGSDAEHGGTVQAVDYHHFKQEPGPADPDDPNRHALYPNRNPWGYYGQGNRDDGKAAEQAALDRLQRDMGVPIIRQQVRATHSNVNDPDTGKPQPRYYDGLMPTGKPNQYIGIEAKSHAGVDLTTAQKRFDKAVSADSPATATLNGQPIEIIGTQVVNPPGGWMPPSAQVAQPTPIPGAASAAPPGTPPPPVMRRDDGAPLIPSAASKPLPGWGTHVSPDEAAKSGGEVGDLGKFYRGMFPHVDSNDPENTA